jgi:hypothetical protein
MFQSASSYYVCTLELDAAFASLLCVPHASMNERRRFVDLAGIVHIAVGNFRQSGSIMAVPFFVGCVSIVAWHRYVSSIAQSIPLGF